MTCLRLTTTQSADIGLIAKGLVSLWLLDLGTGWKFDGPTIHGSVYFKFEGLFFRFPLMPPSYLKHLKINTLALGSF